MMSGGLSASLIRHGNQQILSRGKVATTYVYARYSKAENIQNVIPNYAVSDLKKSQESNLGLDT